MIGLPITPQGNQTVELAGYVTGEAIRKARQRYPDAEIIANGKTVSLGDKLDLQMTLDQNTLAARRENPPPTRAKSVGYNHALGGMTVEDSRGSSMIGASVGGSSNPVGDKIRIFGENASIPSIPPTTL